MKYDDTDIAGRYDSARHMPEATRSLWLETVAKHVPPREVKVILDVGCGTGRFSAHLAQRFGARVIGIDPSTTMLAKAKENVVHPGVTFLDGDAAHLPVAGESVCLLYLSMVYHHIADPGIATREFVRVLRAGGFLCIRNSTTDLLDHVPYLEYFPGAKEFNRNRLPSQRDVIGTLESNGLPLLAHEVIEQRFADSWEEYCEKISQRGLSDLVALPDAEFDAGVRRMRRAAEQNAPSGPVLELINLFVFRKNG
jgi:ubiquinone/menaquinone biosynthesis C-methylase UbiE